VLIAFAGILIFLIMNLISKLTLGRWHESEMRREQ
jgi:hypothetical protein